MAYCLLEDFLELINSNMNNIHKFNIIENLFSFLKNESECSLFAELCGLIGLNENNEIIYKSMQNRSKSPESFFVIDPYEYLLFIREYKCLAIFHSHLVGDEHPSEFDIKTSENCCYPFMIYSICTEKFFIYEPQYKDYDVNIIQRLKEKI
jgi:proteasome lid subunit RPN8/RPN11